MQTVIFIFILLVFTISIYLNCMLYGAIIRTPYFGIAITEYAEKERDVFTIMYIKGGSLLPHNEKINDFSLSLARRTHEEAFTALQQTEPIGPYAPRKAFDLAAVLVRMLYWIPPLSLAFFFLMLFIPKSSGDTE